MPKLAALKASPGMSDFTRMPHFCTMTWRRRSDQ